MNDRLYRLQGHVGNCWIVYMSEELCDAAMQEWKDWVVHPARDENRLLELNGVANDLERSSQQFVIKMEAIQLMEKVIY